MDGPVRGIPPNGSPREPQLAGHCRTATEGPPVRSAGFAPDESDGGAAAGYREDTRPVHPDVVRGELVERLGGSERRGRAGKRTVERHKGGGDALHAGRCQRGDSNVAVT